MCFGGGSAKATESIAAQERADDTARQARISSGMAKINQIFDNPDGGFTDDFYQKQGQAYTDYAKPQLDKQYADQKNNLIYALSRSGLIDSSAGAKANSDLSSAFDQNRIDIANQAKDIESQSRAKVENARSGLVTSLNATGDDQAASAAAVREAANLNIPTGYSPLGNLFANIASTVANIGSNAKNDYSGFVGGSGLFNTGGGSMRVVRG